LEEARQHARAEMQRLPVAFKSLEKAAQPYAIEISETLKRSLAAMRGEHE